MSHSLEDSIFGAQLFAKAISIMLREGQGVVIDLEENMIFPQSPETRKVIVYCLDGSVNIKPAEEDMNEGDSLNVLDF